MLSSISINLIPYMASVSPTHKLLHLESNLLRSKGTSAYSVCLSFIISLSAANEV